MDKLKDLKHFSDDYFAIRTLIDTYTYCINERDWRLLPELFSGDAVWKALKPIDLQFDGLEEIEKRIPANVEKLEFLFQMSSEILVSPITENSAKVHSQLTEYGRFRETAQGMYAIGTYTDQVIKLDGGWKFAERQFTLKYMDTKYPFNGDIIIEH